jgi:hypothetical protein
MCIRHSVRRNRVSFARCSIVAYGQRLHFSQAWVLRSGLLAGILLCDLRIGSAVLLNLYSLPSTIIVAYAIVIGYSVAWFTNTAFYLGARWGWITRLYWLYDLVLGLVIITPLFVISFFRVRKPFPRSQP